MDHHLMDVINYCQQGRKVLILVVMDHHLMVTLLLLTVVLYKGLNPCCNGSSPDGG